MSVYYILHFLGLFRSNKFHMTDSYFSFLVSSGHTADDQPLQLLPATFALGNMSIMMTTNFKKSTSMTRLRPEGAEQVKIYFLFSTIFASMYRVSHQT